MTWKTPLNNCRNNQNAFTHIALSIALSALPATAFAETATFDLSGFDGISVSEGIHVVVDVGGDFSVVAASDDPRQLRRLDLNVRRGTLHARMDNKPFSFTRTKGWKVTVRVSMPELVQTDVSSGAEMKADLMTGGRLDLEASSGSSLHVATITGDEVSANATSGAEIAVSGGTCKTLDADVSSGSSLDLARVECSDVRVSASSGSSAAVYADNLIDANASSGASVQVHGAHEKIEINSSSGGSIRFP